MMKMFMWFVLALAMVQMVFAQTDVRVNPTVALINASFKADAGATLDVVHLSSPDARLKYVELGDLLPQSGTGEVPLSSSAAGSVGMTGFDGSNITLNVPPAVSDVSAEPLRITGVDNSVHGAQGSNAWVGAASLGNPRLGSMSLPPMGGRPVMQRLARGHYRLEGNALVRQDQSRVQSSSSTSSRNGRGGNSFVHSHH